MSGRTVQPLTRDEEQLCRILVGESHRFRSRSSEETKRAVDDLRVRFVDWVADASLPTEELARRFILHEASVAKMMAAAGVALRSSAQLRGELGHLISGAVVEVLAAFERHRDLNFDPTRGQFGSWLYTIWKNAVSNVRRSLRRGPATEPLSEKQLERVSSSDGQTAEGVAMLDVREMLAVIEGLPAGRLRDVIMDWASGMNGADSARCRGISEARVSQLRKQGIELLRRRFDLTPDVSEE